MKKTFERFLLSPAYPILLSIYPISTLFSTNTYQISYWVFLRPFLLSLLVGLLLFGLMKLIFLEWHKSAFFTMLEIFFLFTYGHIENFLEAKRVSNTSLYILLGWLIVFLFFIFLNRKLKNKLDYSGLAPSINLMAIILLLYPIGKAIQYSVVRNNAFSSQTNSFQELELSDVESPPDIYYIILDAYGRSDVLKEMYDYDNRDFIENLEGLGFYVAECSQSNYPNTGLSLTSALNMDYIPTLNEHFRPDETELFYLFATLENNAVSQMLHNAGYQTIAFASGFSWAEMKDFDTFLVPSSNAINEFEVMYLETTFARLFDDIGVLDLDDIVAERYRERTRFVFDSFSDLAEMPGPKFVFIHLILPHPPYGFDADGNAVSPKSVSPSDGYVNQATYASNQITESAKILIENSATPPVIIIQGDHGPWTNRPDWHLGILNAYYFPEHQDVLYPTITPVNSFRLIFNEYLNAHYDLLPNESYLVKMPYLYDFTRYENPCVK